jgi:hypothetical protein
MAGRPTRSSAFKESMVAFTTRASSPWELIRSAISASEYPEASRGGVVGIVSPNGFNRAFGPSLASGSSAGIDPSRRRLKWRSTTGLLNHSRTVWADNTLMADIDAAFGQQVLHVSQRQRVLHVHHDHEADHLGRAVKVPERVDRFGHLETLRTMPASGNRSGLTVPRERGSRCTP